MRFLFPPSVAATLRQLGRVPFFAWLILAQAFIFVCAPAIAPPAEVGRLQAALTVYMILTLAFLALLKTRPLWMKATLDQGIAYFIGGFVATAVLVSALKGLPGLNTLQLTGPLYLIVFHSLVVATSETFVFQGFLPLLITPVVAQGAFAVFHWAAYLGDLTALITAFVAGLVFYVIARRFNIWLACGIHAGFNIGILGILVG